MIAKYLDALPHFLLDRPSRRDVLRGLARTGHGLAALHLPAALEARKKSKHKQHQPKLKRNAFGCVDVGGKCLGNSANCCSGTCEGKKPKKGKKDGSVCVAHDTGGVCFADTDVCTSSPGVACSLDTNNFCDCLLTTGNAGFCAAIDFLSDPQCRECARDTDCQEEFGPGAACVFLGGACSPLCPDTGRRGCVRPCAVKAS